MYNLSIKVIGCLSVCTKKSRYPLNRYDSPIQFSFTKVRRRFITILGSVPPLSKEKSPLEYEFFGLFSCHFPSFMSNSTPTTSNATRSLKGRSL